MHACERIEHPGEEGTNREGPTCHDHQCVEVVPPGMQSRSLQWSEVHPVEKRVHEAHELRWP